LCVFTMFDKFAIIITFTIIFSLIMSLGLFSSLCHLIGPNGTQFDLRYWVVRPVSNWIKSLWKKIRGNKGDVSPSENEEKDKSLNQSNEDVEAKVSN
jgi:multidrug efflux pump subunit AcrB